VEPTPLSVISYTHFSYKVQDPFHFSSTIWTISLCFTDQETQEESLLGGTNPFVCHFLHPSLVQSSRSIPLFLYNLDDLCFTDQETQEEKLLGGTNLFVGHFLHPSRVQSSRSIPHFVYNLDDNFIDQETQEENLLGEANSFVGQFLHPSLVQSSRSIPLFFYNLDYNSLFHRSRNSGRELGGTNPLVGQF